MLGIDLVIPDITYLERNRERVRAYLITHGHEDHIGATPYVLPRVPAPVYGTKLTCALIRGKLAEHNIGNIQFHIVKPKDVVEVGAFSVQFIKVSHSIAGAVAMAITCPAGTVIVTGDFKIDYTPYRRGSDRFEHACRMGKPRRTGNAGGIHQRGASRLHDERSARSARPSTTCSRTRRGESSSRCSPRTCTGFSRLWITASNSDGRFALSAGAWSTSPSWRWKSAN